VKKCTWLVGVIALSASLGATAGEIAIVNIAEVFQQSPAREAVVKKLEAEFKGRAAELQKMEQELQATIQKLQTDANNIKPAERAKIENETRTKGELFSSKAQAFEQDNRRRQDEERGKILDSIQKTIGALAMKNDYDMVIDSNVVIYNKNVKDITQDVLKQIK
jgi:outer membrane protein